MKQKLLSTLTAILFTLPTTFSQAQETYPVEESSRPPNVIILLADDLGYGDISCYGSPSIETPNIDALAASGTRFTRFYAGSAVCTPSRACLLTGKFPLRFDIRRHFSDVEGRVLPVSATTLPELLKTAGYATAHIGKWHLGGLLPEDYTARSSGKAARPGPLQHGFDHYLCNMEGPLRQTLLRERRLYREGGHSMIGDDHRRPPDDRHWTDIKTDEAIRMLEGWKKEQQPFFLNLWFDVPHTPYEPAPEPHLSKYEKLGASGDQLRFRSMVSHLDANIGRLITRLKALGLYENTLIIFTSDNGPAFQGSPGPFRGGKTDLHEGGLRVPMIAVWPGHIPAQAYSFQTGHMADLLPTICEAAGIAEIPSDLDGKSLLEHLITGKPLAPERILTWQMDLYKQFQNQGPKPKPFATSVALKGRWKLLADSLQPTELFDLKADHRELNNLLGKHPEIEKELLEALKAFHAAPRSTGPATKAFHPAPGSAGPATSAQVQAQTHARVQAQARTQAQVQVQTQAQARTQAQAQTQNSDARPKHIFMAGNSTMANKPYRGSNPEKGWGQVFALYFNEKIKVENHAVNGRSSKSFIDEGKWDNLLRRVQPGDYVIIEFGHNDEKKEDPARYAAPDGAYRQNLKRFVSDVRNKGGIPVLATPIVRRRFDESGEFYDTHGRYPEVVRELAREEKVALLDLHRKTRELLEQYGPNRSKSLFLHIQPGEYPSLPEGKEDDTHLSGTGAFRICDLVVEEMKSSLPELYKYLKR